MPGGITTKKQQEIGGVGFAGVSAIISAAAERASIRLIEFFTATFETRTPGSHRAGYFGMYSTGRKNAASDWRT
jgi:hypothetical protein